LLAGALSAAAVLGQVTRKNEAKRWGFTMIAIRPDTFVDDFEGKAVSIISTVKASENGICIPRERSTLMAQGRIAADVMPIPTKIWESILHTSQNRL